MATMLARGYFTDGNTALGIMNIGTNKRRPKGLLPKFILKGTVISHT